jgi:hypothetical protein
MGLFGLNGKGSKPIAVMPIVYGYDYPQHDYQAKWTWPWPPNPAQHTIAAVTNCWTGNQLPGDTNFIPNVAASHTLWIEHTEYMNTLVNKQYNVGLNIETQSAVQSAILTQMIQQAWQNRMGYAYGV